jgi:N-acetylneuraminic acid mutarotase
MKRLVLLLSVVVFAMCAVPADGDLSVEVEANAALPMPLSNNAVASVTVDDRQYLVSFAGLGSGRSHADTLDKTFVLDSVSGRWRESVVLPGGVGRLASVAVSVGELAYVFGGYTVAADDSETSLPLVHAFDPLTREFTALSAMPVPVDDAVAVTFLDRFIYLISGWHDLGNVNLVQRYDVETDTWVQATPIPGKPVFGHAGGIVGNRIVYCDGVAIKHFADQSRDFVANDECFLGLIDESDIRRIDWRQLQAHPGLPRYRMAAAGVESLNAVVFIGGSDNPYNYDGIGYNGEPSEPAVGGLLLDLDSLSWRELSLPGPATMDHRGLVPYAERWLTVGGMLAGQEVTDRVIAYKLD